MRSSHCDACLRQPPLSRAFFGTVICRKTVQYRQTRNSLPCAATEKVIQTTHTSSQFGSRPAFYLDTTLSHRLAAYMCCEGQPFNKATNPRAAKLYSLRHHSLFSPLIDGLLWKMPTENLQTRSRDFRRSLSSPTKTGRKTNAGTRFAARPSASVL